jgi:serine/threonine protein kinase
MAPTGGPTYNIVLPLILTNLSSVLRVPEVVSRAKVKILQQVLSALVHLHTNNLAHRDIKSANILVDRYGPHPLVLISDYGCGTLEMPAEYDNEGTIHCLAPEQRKGERHDHRVDCWQAGLVAAELLGFVLEKRISNLEELQPCHDFLDTHTDPDEAAIATVAKALLAINPKDRLTALEGAKHLNEHLSAKRISKKTRLQK